MSAHKYHLVEINLELKTLSINLYSSLKFEMIEIRMIQDTCSFTNENLTPKTLKIMENLNLRLNF